LASLISEIKESFWWSMLAPIFLANITSRASCSVMVEMDGEETLFVESGATEGGRLILEPFAGPPSPKTPSAPPLLPSELVGPPEP
jgi:hypothetical protein